jgi:hypothetical protein
LPASGRRLRGLVSHAADYPRLDSLSLVGSLFVQMQEHCSME